MTISFIIHPFVKLPRVLLPIVLLHVTTCTSKLPIILLLSVAQDSSGECWMGMGAKKDGLLRFWYDVVCATGSEENVVRKWMED